VPSRIIDEASITAAQIIATPIIPASNFRILKTFYTLLEKIGLSLDINRVSAGGLHFSLSVSQTDSCEKKLQPFETSHLEASSISLLSHFCLFRRNRSIA